MTADEAFDKALDWLKQVKGGLDPYQIELDAVARSKQALKETVSALVPLFIEKRCANMRRKAHVEYVLKRHLLPILGSRPVREIKRTEIIALVDRVETGSGPAMANSAYSWARLFFNFCEDRDLLDRNPCVRVRTPPLVSRDRVFDDREYRAIWLASGLLSPLRRAFVRTLLLTGARRGEVAGMRWSELNRDDRIWSVPPERMKNGRWHEVAMTPYLVSMLDEIRVEGCRYVFPAYDLNKEFLDFTGLKRQLVEAIGKVDPELAKTMPRWCLHDMRRSMRTRLSSLGIDSELAERVISHTPDGVQAVYNRHSYRSEKRAAMVTWQNELGRIVGDDSLKAGPKLVVAA
jgi:integrase